MADRAGRLCRAAANAEIGTILALSVSTARFHLRNAEDKLGATTRTRMIQLATGHGLLGPHA